MTLWRCDAVTRLLTGAVAASTKPMTLWRPPEQLDDLQAMSRGIHEANDLVAVGRCHPPADGCDGRGIHEANDLVAALYRGRPEQAQRRRGIHEANDLVADGALVAADEGGSVAASTKPMTLWRADSSTGTLTD